MTHIQNKEAFLNFGIRQVVDSDVKIPNSFKNAVCQFIYDNKRLPNKIEMTAIREEHLPTVEKFDTNHKRLMEEYTQEWNTYSLSFNQEYMQEWATAPAPEIKDFIAYVNSEVASQSALGSTKGINKHNLQHRLI